MNDSELCTAVRESVTDIHSAAPLAQIISRGRAMRARRRIPAVAAGLALAACTGVAVASLTSAGHPGPGSAGGSADYPGSDHAGVRLAAWTVAKQANGDIDVTVNQLEDAAGLQATLRADGLPVTVSFSGHLRLSPSCRPYATASMNAVTVIRGDTLVIDRSALPSGAGVAISVEPGSGLPVRSGTTPTLGGSPPPHPAVPPLLKALNGLLAIGIVYASRQCTGS
jgi:hypothetical protein